MDDQIINPNPADILAKILGNDPPLASKPPVSNPPQPAVVEPPSLDPVMPSAPAFPAAPPVPVVAVPAEPVPPQPPPATSNNPFEGKGMGKYKVVVVKDKCIGAASCVAVASKAFRLNDQQIAEVLPTIAQETDENLLLAAQSCPTLAIEVYDTATGEKVWPK